jgi:hypothetical protein
MRVSARTVHTFYNLSLLARNSLHSEIANMDEGRNLYQSIE